MCLGKNLSEKIKYKMKFALKYFCFLLVFFVVFSIFNVSEANAANLYFSPSSGNFSVGNILSTSVFVNTQGESINDTDAIINFPADLLEVVSLSKSGSIFSLWVQEPSFSNSAGTITFNGGLPTPGFDGTAGKIVNIVFRVKSAGSASLVFSSAAVRANDGFGTNVLQARAQALFTLKAVEEPTLEKPAPEEPTLEKPAPEEVPSTTGTPSATKISSPTHPNPGEWYSNNSPKFTWNIPSGITGIRLSMGSLPTSAPNIFYSEQISEKQLEDLADGIWYFHVQLRNKVGWGGVSHFKFQIDTQTPKPFVVEVKEGKETTTPQPTLLFETIDEMSGIDHYEIIIDQESPIMTKSTEYKIQSQNLGKHTIIVKAVDKARNETLAITQIEILAIEAPVITDYPSELLPSSILLIKGTAIPETTIKVYVKKDKGEVKIGETKSDKEGKWVFIEVEPVERGVYSIWAQTINASGSKSGSSEEISILVSPPVFIKIGQLAIDYLTTIMTLLILILAIIFGIFWAWLIIKEKRKKGINDAEKALHKAFKNLMKETEKQVKTLDGKPGLSKREKKVCNNLKKALKTAEKNIDKEIKDI